MLMLYQRMTNRSQGFTLVELISVLLVLSIVAVVVLPRFTGTQSFQNRQLLDQLIAITRFSQQSALSRYNHQITLNLSQQAVSGDWLFRVLANDGSGDIELKRLITERGSGTLSLLSPQTVTINALTTLSIGFDNLGNITAPQISGTNSNLSFNASGRFFCISLAGYAYEAASQADCENN
ncbi:type II secretion system protein [Motiliproteus sp. MSK22-1]|uniref:type II secretion system protein n=1 Tax=Motiliproteus sp. MSK22-1 TaxID=1897630 RepID=UPI00097542D4|nr:type II secretion system protein [Motiliproteus sp. MSK22-1]OMH39533.1 hypothetical protein BGP75_02790 [Motiliproteus sp. MSK22-1]